MLYALCLNHILLIFPLLSICNNKQCWIVGMQFFGGLQVIISTGVWSKVERRLCVGEASTKYSKEWFCYKMLHMPLVQLLQQQLAKGWQMTFSHAIKTRITFSSLNPDSIVHISMSSRNNLNFVCIWLSHLTVSQC